MAFSTLAAESWIGSIIARDGIAAVVNLVSNLDGFTPAYAVQIEGGTLYASCPDLDRARAVLAAVNHPARRPRVVGYSRAYMALWDAYHQCPKGSGRDVIYAAIEGLRADFDAAVLAAA